MQDQIKHTCIKAVGVKTVFVFNPEKKKKRISRTEVKQSKSSHCHKPSPSQKTFNQQQSRLRPIPPHLGSKGMKIQFFVPKPHCQCPKHIQPLSLSFSLSHSHSQSHKLKIGVYVIKTSLQRQGHTSCANMSVRLK